MVFEGAQGAMDSLEDYFYLAFRSTIEYVELLELYFLNVNWKFKQQKYRLWSIGLHLISVQPEP